MAKMIRTRIAPSPTGQDLHIGNAYTAYINYLVAKKSGGQFLVRIEDTDQTRLVEGSESRILSSLRWLGIAHDEGPDIGGPHSPYRQSERLHIYKKHALELVASGRAYYCFCTSERLEQMRKDQEVAHKPPMYDGLCKSIDRGAAKKRAESGEKYVIRLNVPDDGTTTFTDIIRGEISFENKLIDDQVLLKSDGFPTYHLGVVVDDHIMDITHVIRGEEWIPSTPKHIILYEFFEWEKPQYAHVSVLRNPDKSKLSKRKNPVWASWFREQGFLPDAIRNYFGTMAWAFPGGREIFTTSEMMEHFTLDTIQTTAPVFDLEKLKWMNGQYIKNMADKDLYTTLVGFDSSLAARDKEKMMRMIPLVKERMRTLAEFWPLAGFVFERPTIFESFSKAGLMASLASLSSVKEDWNHQSMEKAIRDEAEKSELKARDVFMDLRVAITGKKVGPPLLESLEVIGAAGTISVLQSDELKKRAT